MCSFVTHPIFYPAACMEIRSIHKESETLSDSNFRSSSTETEGDLEDGS